MVYLNEITKIFICFIVILSIGCSSSATYLKHDDNNLKHIESLNQKYNFNDNYATIHLQRQKDYYASLESVYVFDQILNPYTDENIEVNFRRNTIYIKGRMNGEIDTVCKYLSHSFVIPKPTIKSYSGSLAKKNCIISEDEVGFNGDFDETLREYSFIGKYILGSNSKTNRIYFINGNNLLSGNEIGKIETSQCLTWKVKPGDYQFYTFHLGNQIIASSPKITLESGKSYLFYNVLEGGLSKPKHNIIFKGILYNNELLEEHKLVEEHSLRNYQQSN